MRSGLWWYATIVPESWLWYERMEISEACHNVLYGSPEADYITPFPTLNTYNSTIAETFKRFRNSAGCFEC